MLCDSVYPRMVKFLGAGKKVKISNFISLFCLKDKLLGQKTDTAVSSPDTEGLWKVLAKSELWFPIQPTPKWSRSRQEGRKFKFHWFVLSEKTQSGGD